MLELAIFTSTFLSVFALGFQSQNVNQGHYLAAALTSLVIGGSTLWLYKLLPEADITQCAAYLLGGVLGILASMRVHRWLFRQWGRK